MSRLIATIFILALCSSDSFAQRGKVAELGDKLFFNILIHQPDTSVYSFVKRYFPSFTEVPRQGGWTMYPSDTLIIPRYDTTIHSLRFWKHPYFKAKFSEGRLDFFTLENNDSGPGITDFQLWFYFDSQKDASYAFQTLCDGFKKISKTQRMEKQPNNIIARYSGKEKADKLDCNEIILLPDELYKGRYKILFRLWPLQQSKTGA